MRKIALGLSVLWIFNAVTVESAQRMVIAEGFTDTY